MSSKEGKFCSVLLSIRSSHLYNGMRGATRRQSSVQCNKSIACFFSALFFDVHRLFVRQVRAVRVAVLHQLIREPDGQIPDYSDPWCVLLVGTLVHPRSTRQPYERITIIQRVISFPIIITRYQTKNTL